jgi:hypothetical protein
MERKISEDYIAGFFDGEGCIFLGKVASASTHTHYTYSPKVLITNSNLDVLKIIQGFLNYGTIHKQSSTHKQVYVLRLDTMGMMLYFLQGFRPLLRIKAEEADLMIEFLERRLQYKGTNYRHAPYVYEDEVVYQKLKRIKGTRSRTKAKGLKVASTYKWQEERAANA